jgi:hypothetical protein
MLVAWIWLTTWLGFGLVSIFVRLLSPFITLNKKERNIALIFVEILDYWSNLEEQIYIYTHDMKWWFELLGCPFLYDWEKSGCVTMLIENNHLNPKSDWRFIACTCSCFSGIKWGQRISISCQSSFLELNEGPFFFFFFFFFFF